MTDQATNNLNIIARTPASLDEQQQLLADLQSAMQAEGSKFIKVGGEHFRVRPCYIDRKPVLHNGGALLRLEIFDNYLGTEQRKRIWCPVGIKELINAVNPQTQLK